MSTPVRVDLVAGAARGIGAATVLELATAGWSVVAVDLARDDPTLPYALATSSDLAAVVAEAERAAGAGTCRSFVAEVGSLDELARAVAFTERTFGGLDAAIACAGVIGRGAAHWELPVEHERTVLEVNLQGVLNLARAAVPALLRRRNRAPGGSSPSRRPRPPAACRC